MPDSFTPNLNMVLCEVGASRDSWGTKWNENLTTLDQFVFMGTPIGMLADFAGPNAPDGWLICDGRLISRTTYSALFAVIGTYWGAGDGSTTFALPNLNGRSTVGPGAMIDAQGVSYTFGFTSAQGFVFNTITQANLPNYALYCDVQGYHAHSGATTAAGAHAHTTDAQGIHSHGGATVTENVAHTHSGTTDFQGAHSHTTFATTVGLAGAPNQIPIPQGAPGNYGGGTDVQGNHGHNYTTNGENQLHVHGINADGNHAHTTTTIGDHAHGIYGDGSHSHNVYLNGSGQGFQVLGPILVVTKIIYAGTQASTAVALDVAPMTIEHEPDALAAIRAELAQLRALVAPQRQRVLSSPMRGAR